MVDVTFVFTQVRKGRRKITLEDVSDYSFDEESGELVIEHDSGPDTTFNRVRRVDGAYRGSDPEYAGPDAEVDTEY